MQIEMQFSLISTYVMVLFWGELLARIFKARKLCGPAGTGSVFQQTTCAHVPSYKNENVMISFYILKSDLSSIDCKYKILFQSD